MKYADWTVGVMAEIKNDPIWKLEVYRLALFAGDIGWHDVLAISKEKLMWSVADQLHRSLDSISVNLTEGYSVAKVSTVPASSKHPSAPPVNPEIGITNPATFYVLKSSVTAWDSPPTLSACSLP
jgi:hypothetical protein